MTKGLAHCIDLQVVSFMTKGLAWAIVGAASLNLPLDSRSVWRCDSDSPWLPRLHCKTWHTPDRRSPFLAPGTPYLSSNTTLRNSDSQRARINLPECAQASHDLSCSCHLTDTFHKSDNTFCMGGSTAYVPMPTHTTLTQHTGWLCLTVSCCRCEKGNSRLKYLYLTDITGNSSSGSWLTYRMTGVIGGQDVVCGEGRLLTDPLRHHLVLVRRSSALGALWSNITQFHQVRNQHCHYYALLRNKPLHLLNHIVPHRDAGSNAQTRVQVWPTVIFSLTSCYSSMPNLNKGR